METEVIKSCFNCKHLHHWDVSATQCEPADSGWECNYPNMRELPDPGEITPNPKCEHCQGHGYYYDGEPPVTPYAGAITGKEIGISPCQC